MERRNIKAAELDKTSCIKIKDNTFTDKIAHEDNGKIILPIVLSLYFINDYSVLCIYFTENTKQYK